MHTLPESGSRPAPLLEVRNLSAGYGRVPAVSGVDIQVGANEVVSIVGPNGAGKSTLLKAITGNLPLLSGTVMLSGRDVSNLPGDALAHRGLAYVPQVNDTFNTLTVRENLEIGGYLLRRRDLGDRIEECLRIFPQLAEMADRRAQKLSGGERKMLAVARVLMTGPRIVILDEPTAGLSPQMADQVLSRQVPRVAALGAAVLIVEQRALEALQVSNWGYVLVGGRVASSARADVLRESDIAEAFLGRQSRPGEAGAEVEHGRRL